MPSHAMALHRARWLVAALRVQAAVLRSRLLLRGYDPNQPRVPAGSQEGGRWTDGDVGDPGFVQDDDRVRLAENETGRPRPINLREEESRGGHTLRDHVGKADAYLLGIVSRDKGSLMFLRFARISEGSFDSQENAEDFVNKTIDANNDAIDVGLKIT